MVAEVEMCAPVVGWKETGSTDRGSGVGNVDCGGGRFLLVMVVVQQW
jgi:hypothetical protein